MLLSGLLRRAAVLGALASVIASVSVAAPAVAATRRTTRSRFVVVLHDERDADQVSHDHAARYGASIKYVYRRALHGYAATMTTASARQLRHDPAVMSVESDRMVRIKTARTPRVPWDLDRIDQPSLPLDGAFHPQGDGSGVTAYVIDTGTRTTHHEFGGRASIGYDAIGGASSDCNGHGTHVAGTIGGATHGVARNVRLVAVRVLDCDGHGLASSVIAGIDWVTSNHRPGQPAVANMSLGGLVSPALDRAITRSIADGVTYAVAAGNEGGDACNTSPAHVPDAITVAATDRDDAAPAWSNNGPCVDLYAPGKSITSAWYTSDSATRVKSGTSMASPHVAGAAALYLQAHLGATPAQVASALIASSTHNIVNAPPGTSRSLLRV